VAHVIGNKAEQAYQRSDALARRRELMDPATFDLHRVGAAAMRGVGDNVLTFKQPT
jgi:hypothetical protein